MTEHVTRTGTGLIGWFDILGYRQILAHNEAETVFKLLADTIAEIPAAIIQSFQPRENSQETPEGTKAGEVGKEFDWLPFSDTVLVTLPCARSFEPVDRACRFFAFI